MTCNVWYFCPPWAPGGPAWRDGAHPVAVLLEAVLEQLGALLLRQLRVEARRPARRLRRVRLGRQLRLDCKVLGRRGYKRLAAPHLASASAQLRVSHGSWGIKVSACATCGCVQKCGGLFALHDGACEPPARTCNVSPMRWAPLSAMGSRLDTRGFNSRQTYPFHRPQAGLARSVEVARRAVLVRYDRRRLQPARIAWDHERRRAANTFGDYNIHSCLSLSMLCMDAAGSASVMY